MKKHFAKLLLLGAMIVAGFSFVGCNDIEKELADLNNKVENLESESAKNLQDAINALNAKLASDYALKTDVSALEIALKGTIAEQVAVAEAKINKAIEDAIAACKAESADAIAKVSADLAKVSEELTAVAGDVKAATAKIDENAAAIAGVDAKVLELKGTIDALADYLDTLEGMARENKATLDSFAEYFAEYKGDVDMKLTELHGSLGALSVYLEELEASIDARFAEHQNTFLALSAFLEEHEIEVDAKFKEILGTFDALAAHLEEREAKIDFALEEINGTFAALSPVIETMQAQIKETHNTLEALADYLDEKEAETQLALEQLHGQLEALSPVVAEMQAKIEENHQTLLALSDFLEKADYQGQIDSLKADVAASIAMARELDQTLRFDLAAHIKTLEDQLAALEGGQVDLDAVKAEVNAVINQLVEDLTGRVATLENRLQSVSFVPEWNNGPKAVKFEENEDYGFVAMSFEVAPKAYATKITTENTKLVGLALKAADVEQYDVQILSANETTGIVEVIGYVDAKSTIWKADNAALALRVMAEDAQVTSSYVDVKVLDHGTPVSINEAVYFGAYNNEGKFIHNATTDSTTPLNTLFTYALPFDTTVAESEVELFEKLEARVYVDGFMDYLTPAFAAELLGIEIDVETKLSSFATDFFVTTNNNVYDFVANPTTLPSGYVKEDTPAFTVANDKTLDVTVKFNEVVIDSLSKVENGLKTYFDGKSATVALKDGFYRVNGKKAVNFAKGAIATYQVGKPQTTESLVVNAGNSLLIEWSTENCDLTDPETNPWSFRDLDVTGGNAREILGDPCVMSLLDKDGKVATDAQAIADAPEVTVTFISIDNADAKVKVNNWPEEETTYNYTYKKVAPADKDGVIITTTFNLSVTVSAAPEAIGEVPVSNNVTVTLTENDDLLEDTSVLTTEVALNGVVEALLPYYKDYFKTEKDAKEAIVAAINGADVTVKVDNNGELVEQTIDATYIYVAPTTTPAVAPEASIIEIAYVENVYEVMSENYVQFSFDVEIYGIKATVTADCPKVAKWTKKVYSAAAPQIVAGRLAPQFKGVQTFKLTSNPVSVKTGDKVDYSYTYYSATSAPYAYDTKVFNFVDYVDIKIAKDDTKEYQVRWSVTPANNVHYTNTGTTANPNFVTRDKLPEYVVYKPGMTLIPANVSTYLPTVDVATENKALKNMINGEKGYYQAPKEDFYRYGLSWGDTDLASYTITIQLVEKNTDPATATQTPWKVVPGVSFPLTFTTDEVINRTSGVEVEQVKVKWSENRTEEPMTANVVDGIKVKDFFGTYIHNYGATTIENFFYETKLDKVETEKQNTAATNEVLTPIYGVGTVWADDKLAYGQDIEIVAFDHDSNITTDKVYITNNKGMVEDTHFTFNETSGAFEFIGNTKPASAVTFTVHVQVSHMNDGGKPIEKVVNIVVEP